MVLVIEFLPFKGSPKAVTAQDDSGDECSLKISAHPSEMQWPRVRTGHNKGLICADPRLSAAGLSFFTRSVSIGHSLAARPGLY